MTFGEVTFESQGVSCSAWNFLGDGDGLAGPGGRPAARTAIGRSFKGTLTNTSAETLITTILPEVVRRWTLAGRYRRPHLRRITLWRW